MDPTQDPNFIPPSSNPDMKPPANSSMIPNNPTIQPYVIADYNEAIDAPQPHPSSSYNSRHSITSSSNTMQQQQQEQMIRSNSSLSLDSNTKIQHKKIPRLPTELQPFSSDSSSSSDNEEEGQNQEPSLYKKSIKHIHHPQHNINTHTNSPKIHSYQIADLEEVPHGIVRQSKTLEDYQFPTHRLSPVLKDSTKFPLVIVACGSFSPVTYLHLRMFEMAMDSIREDTKFEVIGGYYSPVSDNYKKQGLAPHYHRVRMCELACERTSSWLMVDAWESLQPRYTRTALVLDHFNEEINLKRGGIKDSHGRKRGVKIMLLAGGDLIESMGEPNVWAELDLHHILGKYGCLIVERTGSDVRSFLLSHDIMYEHRKNILVIKQLIYNDISSTKVRLFIRRGMSVQYLLPNSVIRYIQEHGLYLYDKEPVKQVMSEKAD